jgi:hypothetical protein
MVTWDFGEIIKPQEKITHMSHVRCIQRRFALVQDIMIRKESSGNVFKCVLEWNIGRVVEPRRG